MRPGDQPSVSQMAEVAVNKLKKNPNGFYLFVEGGQIDFGHHGNEAIAALYEFKVRGSPNTCLRDSSDIWAGEKRATGYFDKALNKNLIMLWAK